MTIADKIEPRSPRWRAASVSVSPPAGRIEPIASTDLRPEGRLWITVEPRPAAPQ
jgi:hypothetical protein